VAYDDPNTGEVFILVINQALHFPEMEHNLLNPNQCRANGIAVNDVPKHMMNNPSDDDHSIHLENQRDLGGEGKQLPLSMIEIVSYLPTRLPTDEEWRSRSRLTLTYDFALWDPHSPIYAEQEENMTDRDGYLHPPVNH
jgi:hypothetical protein